MTTKSKKVNNTAPVCSQPSDDSDNESAPMLDCMNGMFAQQNQAWYEILSQFLTDGDKNICQTLNEVRDAINITNRCLVKLCQTIEKVAPPTIDKLAHPPIQSPNDKLD